MSFNYENRYLPYEQVNTNEILKKVRDQKKFKKLSNKERDEIYVLHIISLFQKKGINMHAFRTDLKIDNQYIFTGFIKKFNTLVQSKYESVTPSEIGNFTNILSGYDEDTLGIFVASSFSKKAMNFVNTYSRKIFLIVDNLRDSNNFDEIYNDIKTFSS
ncbi:354_t:CDS:2 [Cetraspora pellucida]|uniref:354_t:CDS:1 n=1 Tax=Cetraspora pellucida TaxID=1433469 RepID=A0ACA9PEK6_9GLOM|nr:354_t:CDS:2 [Cetraspora pellucida]